MKNRRIIFGMVVFMAIIAILALITLVNITLALVGVFLKDLTCFALCASGAWVTGSSAIRLIKFMAGED